MTDRTLGDVTDPDAVGPTDGVLPGLGSGAAPSGERRGRRALWISVAAVGVIAAVSYPVITHFVRHTPTAPTAPDHVAGLTIDKSAGATGTADYLRSAIAAGLGLSNSVGAVYTAPGTQGDARAVIFVGGTTTQGTNESQVSGLVALMEDSTDGVTGLTAVNPGTAGGLMKCGLTTDTDKADAGTDNEMAMCAYAHDGSVGIALFPNRTLEQAADLMRSLRPSFQK